VYEYSNVFVQKGRNEHGQENNSPKYELETQSKSSKSNANREKWKEKKKSKEEIAMTACTPAIVFALLESFGL